MKELMGAKYNGNIVDLLITQFGLGIFSQYFIGECLAGQSRGKKLSGKFSTLEAKQSLSVLKQQNVVYTLARL